MHPPPQLRLDLLQLGTHTIPSCLPFELKIALSATSADMCESQEVEGFRLSQPAFLPVDRCKAAKLDQACLVRVELKQEFLQSFPQCHQEPLGIVGSFEADHGIIGVTHDNEVSAGVMFAPAVDPEVEDVMEKDVGQQGREPPPPAEYLPLWGEAPRLP